MRTEHGFKTEKKKKKKKPGVERGVGLRALICGIAQGGKLSTKGV